MQNEMITPNKEKGLDDEYGQDYLEQINVDSTTSIGQLALKDNKEVEVLYIDVMNLFLDDIVYFLFLSLFDEMVWN